MKLLLFIFFSIILVGCSTNKPTYWCGDHACIDKDEKSAFFKETMIVEIKEVRKDSSTIDVSIEEMMERANKKKKI